MKVFKTASLWICLFVAFSSSAQSWLSGYQYRKPVTIAAGDITGTGTLTDFPVLVSITSSDLDNSTAHVTSADGFDIVFADADGTTRALHQLVSFNAGTGAIVAWVQLDLDGTSGNTFYMYYGDSDVTTDQSSGNTWNSNYIGVWPLDETTSSAGATYSDLTDNGNDLTDNGGTGNIAGKVGNAQNFDGTNDWLQVDDNSSLRNITDQFTFSAWVQLDGVQADDYGIVIKNEDGTYYQHLGVESTERPSWRVRTGGATTIRDNSDIDADLNDGAWHHLVGVYDGSNMIFYVDGMEEDNVVKTGNVDSNAEPLLLGRRAIGDNRFYDGDIDEARYLNVGLSADWVGTEFTNQDDAINFVSASTEESITPIDGGVATAASSAIFSGNTTSLTLSNFTSSGTTLQWQSSTDGVSFTDVVGGSGATGLVYTTASLTVDTYFRCIVDDATESVASTSALVTIKTEFASGSGPTGYSLRRKLTLDNTEVSGSADHTNFPVLIRLADSKLVSDLIYSGNGGDVAHQNGYDIIFTSSDGTTELDHQIEQYDPSTGDYVAWVMLPTLSYNSDTEIYMYYGNPAVTTDPSDDIFDTDYVGTWHLHDEYDDAVSTGNDGISFGAVSNDSGIIANGARFSPTAGASDFTRIEVGTFDPDQTDITVSAWYNRDATNNGTTDGRIISKSDGQSADAHVFMISIVGGDDNRIRLTGTENDDSNAETLEAIQNINFTPGSWVYSAFTYTANGNVLVYEDGVLVDTETGLDDREKIEQNSGYRVAIGNNPGPADGGHPTRRKPFDGVIDEMRVANVVRSADWLLTEYNNQRENSTFCIVGEEEGCDVDGGTISAVDENIFTGESTTLETIGSSGTLQWQSSTDNVTFSDIGSATSATYNTTSLTETTYFRVTSTAGTCVDASNVVTINVQGRFLSNFAYRKSITIDKSKVAGSTNFSEFPLLISITDSDLATTANGGNVYDIDAGNGTLGDDITFTDASGNELTQYRESYDDATGALVVWVKIPTLSATQDTEIFIYYGNCLGTGLPNLFNTNTWNNDSNSDDYAAVWLMNDTAPTTVVDATANSLDGTGNGLAASTAGQIDGAIDLEAGDANDNFTYSSYTSSGSALTISAWINPESLAGGVGDDAIILSHSDFELKTIVADLAVDENELSFEVTTSGAVSVESLPSDLAAGSFMMVTGVYDGSNVTIYENGNPIASAAQTGTLSGTNSDILIGNNAADGLPFDGLIDHVTILPAARSADWVKTMYNNQSDPGSFYTYASANEESQVAWVGGASGAETDFNNANNWSNCVVPANTESIILESGLSNYPVLTQNTQVVDLIIESGATFGLGGFELTVTGRLTNNGTFTHSNGKVTFAGSAEQQLSGSSATTLYDVEVNNPGNEVRIETTTTIENTVTLTSGFITISDNPLTLTSTGEISGGSATSFFITEGAQCLEQENIGATGRTGNILFPLGISSAEYTPITINNAGTDDDFCVRVADNVYSGGNIGSGTQLTSRMIDKTWFVDEAVIGGSNATLTIQWNVGDELVDFDRTDMFIRHYTSSWVQYESGITASNPGANVYSASTAGVTSFSPVGGGSGDGPLPIELLSFSVTAQDSHVNIKWSTATETNNDYFSLYQSTDGISFSEIGRISGAGNSSQLLNYAWKDLNPSTGINYYYLRQTDFDGAFENFDIKSATIERSDVVDLALTIYPNPASGTFHLIGSGFGSDQEVLVSISDMTGKVIFSKIENSEVDGTLQVQHSLRKSSGIYFINMESFGRKIQKKLILRN